MKKLLLLTIIATGLFTLTGCGGEDAAVADDTTPDYVADVDVDIVEDEVYDDEEVDVEDDIERPVVDGFPEHLLTVTTEEIIAELGEPYETEIISETFKTLTWYVRSGDGYLQRLVAGIFPAGMEVSYGTDNSYILEDDVVIQISLIYLDNRDNTILDSDAVAQIIAADPRNFLLPAGGALIAEKWEEYLSSYMPMSEAIQLLGEPTATIRSVIPSLYTPTGVIEEGYFNWMLLTPTLEWGAREDIAGNYIVIVNTFMYVHREEVVVLVVNKLRQVDGEWVPVTLFELVDGQWIPLEQ